MHDIFIYLQEKIGYSSDIIRCNVDVLIIGTGPIGSVYARSLESLLKDPAKRILMIDAGAQQSEKPGEHLRNQYQKNLSEFPYVVDRLMHPVSVQAEGKEDEGNLIGEAVCYAVGGMSTIWSSNIPRFHKFEREGMEYISEAEWGELYTKAESFLEKNDNLFDNSSLHKRIKTELQSSLPHAGVTSLPIAGRTDHTGIIDYTGAYTVLKPLLESNFPGSFQLLPKHRAKRLILENKDSQKKIEYVIVEEVDGDNQQKLIEKHIYAKMVIVACGAIMTPQLLFNSGIRPNALGRYLTEHQIAFTQVCLKNSFIDVGPNNDLPPSVWIPASEDRKWHSQVHKDPTLPKIIDDNSFVDFRWITGIEPVETNRIYFEDSEEDCYGMPRPLFECVPSTADKKRMDEMLAEMEEIVNIHTIFGKPLPESKPAFIPLGAGWHLQGTCRMGAEDDGTSVVNPFGQVWGYDNLFIGGNAVIPTFNCANPTLTSSALALKSAEKILERIKLVPSHL